MENSRDLTTRAGGARSDSRSRRADLASLAAKLALSGERERRRIASGLHDHVGSLLATARLHLAELAIRDDDPDSARVVEAVRALLDEAIRATRSMTFELGSPVLRELGLDAALEQLCEDLGRRNGLRIRFASDDGAKPLDEDAGILIFQAARESLFNVIKHARARTATVTARRVAAAVRVEVADDGVGFDPLAVRVNRGPEGGYGLLSAGEGLRGVGGRLEIESRPGRGTRVVLTAPVGTPRRSPGASGGR